MAAGSQTSAPIPLPHPLRFLSAAAAPIPAPTAQRVLTHPCGAPIWLGRNGDVVRDGVARTSRRTFGRPSLPSPAGPPARSPPRAPPQPARPRDEEDTNRRGPQPLQEQAALTDQRAGDGQDPVIVPLLGLAGEARRAVRSAGSIFSCSLRWRSLRKRRLRYRRLGSRCHDRCTQSISDVAAPQGPA
jgi:hypothetical protein